MRTGESRDSIRKKKRHKSKISLLSRSRVARLLSMANCFGPIIARKTRSFHSPFRTDMAKAIGLSRSPTFAGATAGKLADDAARQAR